MLIAPRHLWTGGALRERLAVETDGRAVTALRPLGPDTPDAAPRLLLPRPTDLQVNGGGGVLLNDQPTAEGMRAIASAHRALGTGSLLPTLITDAPEVMEAAAEATLACAGTDGILGLHLEGPHIARPGIHDPAHIRPLDERTVTVLRRLRAARIPVLLTLAPERVEPSAITALAAMGVSVWAGHSEASSEEARAAFAAGVSGVTHLFNAMPPMLARAPGLAGAALVSDAFCGVIADGHHLAWETVAVAIRARARPGRTVLVSDAMPSVGGPDRFRVGGREVHLRDGRLAAEDGTLAGAHLTMLEALANVHRHAGVSLAEAVAMATDAPRAALGLPPQTVAPGTPLSEIAMLDDDLRLIPWR